MRFGLIGYPIGHSLSPDMFRACYPQHIYDLIETQDFDKALETVRREYDAVNVTAPFKEQAFAAADEADAAATRLRAANILLRQGSRLIAMNSDWLAVRSILSGIPQLGPDSRILVIGCGGAGKAAAYAASSLGFKTAVANRTITRALEFCSDSPLLEAVSIEESIRRIAEFNVIIYAIPVVIPQIEAIRTSDAVIVEANYRNPVFTGDRCIPGTEWLAYQAIPGFRAMAGEEPDHQKILGAIHK